MSLYHDNTILRRSVTMRKRLYKWRDQDLRTTEPDERKPLETDDKKSIDESELAGKLSEDENIDVGSLQEVLGFSSFLIDGISFDLNENFQVEDSTTSSPCVIDGGLEVSEGIIEVNENSCDPNRVDKESGEPPTSTKNEPPGLLLFIHKAVEPRETANYDVSATNDKPEPQQEEGAKVYGEIGGFPELQCELPGTREKAVE